MSSSLSPWAGQEHGQPRRLRHHEDRLGLAKSRGSGCSWTPLLALAWSLCCSRDAGPSLLHALLSSLQLGEMGECAGLALGTCRSLSLLCPATAPLRGAVLSAAELQPGFSEGASQARQGS